MSVFLVSTRVVHGALAPTVEIVVEEMLHDLGQGTTETLTPRDYTRMRPTLGPTLSYILKQWFKREAIVHACAHWRGSGSLRIDLKLGSMESFSIARLVHFINSCRLMMVDDPSKAPLLTRNDFHDSITDIQRLEGLVHDAIEDILLSCDPGDQADPSD